MNVLIRTIFFLSLFHLFGSEFVYAKNLQLHDLIAKTNVEKSDVKLKNPIPFINSLQLRTSFDNSWGVGLDLTKNDDDITRGESELGDENSQSEELTLRFKIDNFQEYKLKKELVRNQRSRKKIIEGMSLGGNAKYIISQYIELKLNRQKDALLRKLTIIYRDKVKVLKAMSKKGSADIIDYLDAVNQLEANRVSLEMHQVTLQNIVKNINSELGTNYVLNDFDKKERLISLNYIESFLKENGSSEGLSTKLAKQEIERLNILSKLRSEKVNKTIDFIDLSIKNTKSRQNSFESISRDDNSSTSEEQSIGFQIGVNVPFLNSDVESRGDILDFIVKKRRAKRELFESRNNFKSLQVNLEALVQSIKTLRSSNALTEAKKILRIYSRQSGTSPLRLLKLNEFIVSENIKQTEIEMELYSKFYEYIYEMDKLRLSNGKLVIRG